MSKQINNVMSDEQLDAISGGCYARDCGEGHRKNDCDDYRKKDCWEEEHCRPRREYDDCRPSHRPHRRG